MFPIDSKTTARTNLHSRRDPSSPLPTYSVVRGLLTGPRPTAYTSSSLATATVATLSARATNSPHLGSVGRRLKPWCELFTHWPNNPMAPVLNNLQPSHPRPTAAANHPNAILQSEEEVGDGPKKRPGRALRITHANVPA